MGGSGLSVFANANKGQGNERGDGTFWTETTVDSGGMFSLRSGRDTALTGAQVSAETVKADVGVILLCKASRTAIIMMRSRAVPAAVSVSRWRGAVPRST